MADRIPTPWWAKAAIVAAILAGILWLASTCSGDGEPSQSTMTTEARSNCRAAVRDKLKAPSTARFSDESITGSGPDGAWSVTGSVDAENAFGAMIRASFSCEVTFAGGEARTVRVATLG